ncbi:hypothetical protein K503DRAFT_768034 [Rhizopogon vinicolor AM-OR11-026]|uniref:Uncharacterized protein n=1 Tax=Rhizopogon vinicolor AM-OR11-026 TaxID=1314800 RepID=A0A1B7N881_9AGAM|nr:hypothetical protein K503DRAFT_768034 [Rhizopogon vinicolor AM-OR11-026]
MTAIQESEKLDIISSPSSTTHVADDNLNDKFLANPMNFSYKTKWTVTLVACAFSGIVGNLIYIVQ